MLIDKELLFSDKQSLAVGTGTTLCSKSVDLFLPGTDALGNIPLHDRGRGNTVQLYVGVTAAFTSGSSTGTVSAQLIYADDAALTSNVVVMEQTPAIIVTTLVVGYQFRLGGTLPSGFPGSATGRFCGIQYVIGTEAITAGNVTAGLFWNRQSNQNSL